MKFHFPECDLVSMAHIPATSYDVTIQELSVDVRPNLVSILESTTPRRPLLTMLPKLFHMNIQKRNHPAVLNL